MYRTLPLFANIQNVWTPAFACTLDGQSISVLSIKYISNIHALTLMILRWNLKCMGKCFVWIRWLDLIGKCAQLGRPVQTYRSNILFKHVWGENFGAGEKGESWEDKDGRKQGVQSERLWKGFRTVQHCNRAWPWKGKVFLSPSYLLFLPS